MLGIRHRSDGWVELVELLHDEAVAAFKDKAEMVKYLEDLIKLV